MCVQLTEGLEDGKSLHHYSHSSTNIIPACSVSFFDALCNRSHFSKIHEAIEQFIIYTSHPLHYLLRAGAAGQDTINILLARKHHYRIGTVLKYQRFAQLIARNKDNFSNHHMWYNFTWTMWYLCSLLRIINDLIACLMSPHSLIT